MIKQNEIDIFKFCWIGDDLIKVCTGDSVVDANWIKGTGYITFGQQFISRINFINGI